MLEGFKVGLSSWHFKWLVWVETLKSRDSIRKIATTSNWKPYHWDDSDVVPGKLTFKDSANYLDRYGNLPRDFCAYVRRVALWPLLRIVTSTLLTIALAFILWTFVQQVTTVLVTLSWVGIMVGVAAAIFAAMGLAALGFQRARSSISAAIEASPEDSFLKNAYATYKQKICTIVRYSKEETS